MVGTVATVLSATDWRLAVYGASAAPTPAFRDCFLVVTIAFAAAVFPALAIRRQVRG